MASVLSYVLITPARNEAAFIERTIQSVISQTVLPAQWIIVNDGSTDGTSTIVRKYTEKYPWITHLEMPERVERNFAGKAHAFNAGYEKVKKISFDIIGSLDADISFAPGYFAFLLDKFAEIPALGVAGTPFREGGRQYNYRFSRKEHVSGACQLFRRECFESIGGYIPIKAGAIDLTAVVTARMLGWRTETFLDTYCVHHRSLGTAQSHWIKAQFKSGYGDYQMGVHPLWQLFRSVYQMGRKPILLNGFMLLSGYCWALIRQAKSPVSDDFIQFRRKEQMQWLKDHVIKAFRLNVRRPVTTRQ